MIESKVADAKNFCRGAEKKRKRKKKEKKLSERSRGDGAPGISAAESCHAALLTVLTASWRRAGVFRGDIGTARRAPPGLEG